MTTTQPETTEEYKAKGAAYADNIFTAIGIFLFAVLVWIVIRGKIRDWTMK